MTTEKNRLIVQYHVICRGMGMSDDDRAALLSGYGVTSSKQLSEEQLISVIYKLQGGTIFKVPQGNPQGFKNLAGLEPTPPEEMDMWRKRVFAAIGAYLRRNNQMEGAERIKAVACRAAKVTDFNKITKDMLRTLYNEFLKKNNASLEIKALGRECELSVARLN